jgi:hypothetical protein
MMEVMLTIQSPEGTRKLPLAAGHLSIGRGDMADLRINDSGLSRLHASLHREGDRVWVLDEDSSNGTIVNGKIVTDSGAALDDGDKITIGDYTTIWINVSRASVAAATSDTRNGMNRLPPAALAALMVAIILIGLFTLSLFKMRGVNPSNTNQPGRYKVNDQATGDAGASADTNSQVAIDAANRIDNADHSRNATIQSGVRKLYLQMSEAEQLEFTYERARHISMMMGNREYQFTGDVLPHIRKYLGAYARRVGNGSSQLWGEDLNLLFNRARRLAPVIIRAFNSQGVPVVVGLYIPLIESEYRECLESPVGAKGLFQFMPETARGYGVDPAERCNPQKMAPAAARYMKHRIAEFGTDAMSVALGIAGYNRSPDSVRRDLADVLNSENKERSFWTLVANSNKLDRYFQNENVKYVPKFLAAAIVGETPWAFGLQMNPLSTYTEAGNED